MARDRRLPAWLGPAALATLGLALRLVRLDFQPLWFDEGYSFYFAGSSVGQLLARTAVDIHPPLYYFILKGWLALFGQSALAGRLLSVLIGAATIPLLYALGRRLGGARLGLWAGLLLAVSPFHVYYSQEVRMYGLVTLLAVLAGLLALRAFEGRGRWGDWVALGLVLLLALYTQYYAAFVPAFLTLYALSRRAWRRRLVPWLLTLAGVLLAYLPWLAYAGPRLLVYVQYKVGEDADLPLSLAEFLRRVLVAFGAGHLEGWLASWWPLALLPAVLAVAGLAWMGVRERLRCAQHDSAAALQMVGFSLAFLLTPVAGAYLVNLLAPFNPPRSERVLLLAMPAFCLLAGYVLAVVGPTTNSGHEYTNVLPHSTIRLFVDPIRGWLAVIRGWLLLAIYLLVAGVSLGAFYTVPRYPDDDYRPLAAEIGRRALPGDAILCVWPWQIGYFEAYLPASPPALIETPGEIYPQPRQFWADDPARMQRDLDDLLARYGRIWLPAYLAAGSTQEALIADYLDRIGARGVSEWYGSTQLSLHVPMPPLQLLAGDFEFGGRLRVSHIAWGGTPAAGTGYLVLSALWEKSDAVAEGYYIALRLTDAAGRSWGQWDAEPLLGQRPFSAWDNGESHELRQALMIEAGTPPAAYELRLSVRGPAGVPLQLAPAGAPAAETEAILGTVTVSRPGQPLSAGALPIGTRLEATFDNQVRLLGFSAGAGPFVPGEQMAVSLFWQCTAAPRRELVTFVQLLDGKGKLAAATESPPTDGLFPTLAWQPADLIRDQQELALPASLPDGSYRLIAGLFDAGDKQRLPITAGAGRRSDYVELGRIQVRGRAHSYTPPAPAHPLQAQFDDVARLVGYNLVREQDGTPLQLTLFWQALREVDHSYVVFVHVYDAAGQRIGQHDSPPGLGAFPTRGWVAGEYIPDPHPVEIGRTAAPMVAWIGLYEPATGGRLPVADAAGNPLGDHLVVELGR